MKTLYILRHGKAEGDNPGGDFARQLSDRGRDNVKHVVKHIKHDGVDVIVTSDAARAVETARIVAHAVQHKAFVEEHSIYDASVDDLVSVVRQLPESAKSAVIVGHNPGLEGLAYRFAVDKSKTGTLKTAGLAHLELVADSWDYVCEDCGRIIAIYNR